MQQNHTSATPRTLLENLILNSDLLSTIKAKHSVERKLDDVDESLQKSSIHHGKDSHSNSFVTPRTALQGIITSSEVMKTVEPLRKQPRLIVAAMVHGDSSPHQVSPVEAPSHSVSQSEKNYAHGNKQVNVEDVQLESSPKHGRSSDSSDDFQSANTALATIPHLLHTLNNQSSTTSSALSLLNNLRSRAADLKKKMRKSSFIEENSSYVAQEPETMSIVPEDDRETVTENVNNRSDQSNKSSFAQADDFVAPSEETSADSGPLHLSRTFAEQESARGVAPPPDNADETSCDRVESAASDDARETLGNIRNESSNISTVGNQESSEASASEQNETESSIDAPDVIHSLAQAAKHDADHRRHVVHVEDEDQYDEEEEVLSPGHAESETPGHAEPESPGHAEPTAAETNEDVKVKAEMSNAERKGCLEKIIEDRVPIMRTICSVSGGQGPAVKASSASVRKDLKQQKLVFPMLASRRPQEPRRERKRTRESIIPASQLAGMMKHFCASKISSDAIEEVEKAFEQFFQTLNEDLEATCLHAKRRVISQADVEVVMKRQKFIDEQHPLHVLIEENFPHEYRDVLLPCATGRGHQCAGTSSSEEPECR